MPLAYQVPGCVPAGWVVASSWRLLFCPAVITNSWSPASEGVIWLATEATIDAAMDLMSVRPGHVRFTESGPETGPGIPPIPGIPGMTLATLMAEVTRRHRLLEQIAAVLTPDAAVARNRRLRSRAVHVSDSQWAILMRLGQPVTPRDLALELGQSVFGTTIEVYRMVIMDLVSVADAPARPAEPDGDASRIRASRIRASRIGASRIGASRIWPALSFIRALT